MPRIGDVTLAMISIPASFTWSFGPPKLKWRNDYSLISARTAGPEFGAEPEEVGVHRRSRRNQRDDSLG